MANFQTAIGPAYYVSPVIFHSVQPIPCPEDIPTFVCNCYFPLVVEVGVVLLYFQQQKRKAEQMMITDSFIGCGSELN